MRNDARLLEKPGVIVSRNQLEERIYGWDRGIESNTVDVLIHTMRKKFGKNLIRDVRGLGWAVRGDPMRMGATAGNG